MMPPKGVLGNGPLRRQAALDRTGGAIEDGRGRLFHPAGWQGACAFTSGRPMGERELAFQLLPFRLPKKPRTRDVR